MRKSQHYTAAPESLLSPSPEVYNNSYQTQPWLTRTFIRVEALFRGQSVSEVMQRREYRVLVKKVAREYPTVVNTEIPALLDGFTEPVRKLASRLQAARPLIEHCTGTRSGAFLYFLLKRRNSTVEQVIDEARSVPPSSLSDSTLTIKEINAGLRREVRDVLEQHREEVVAAIDSPWQCILSLRRLSETPFGDLVPSRTATIQTVPIRSVTEVLIRFHRELQFCASYRDSSVLEAALEFVTSRSNRPSSPPEDLWSVLDAVKRKVPLETVVRLGVEEPRVRVLPLEPQQDWWPLFEQYALDGLDSRSKVFNQRMYQLEEALRDLFSVSADPEFWLPTSLYPRSIDALQRLSWSHEFRRTRLLVGTLAREEEVLSANGRKALLDAHLAIDAGIEELDSLVGTVEKPGTLGEAVRRLKQGTQDRVRLRVEMAKLFAEHRPRVYSVLRQTVDAITIIRATFLTEKPQIMRRVPRISAILGDAFGDVSLRYVIDLVLEHYGPLATAIRGVIAVEHEISAPLETEDEELDAAAEVSGLDSPGEEQPEVTPPEQPGDAPSTSS